MRSLEYIYSPPPKSSSTPDLENQLATKKEKFESRKKLPMMPIRDVVMFPHMMTPFVVGRESSVRALEEALAADKKIFLATQHDARVDEPKANEIYQVGTVANIVQSLKLPDGNLKVLVEGVERGKILQVIDTAGYFQANIRTVKNTTEVTPAIESGMRCITSLFDQYVKLRQSLNYETMIAAVRMEDPAKLTDTIAVNLQLSIEEKQELLEIFDPAKRLNRIADVLDIEIEKLNIDRTIQSRVKRQMERAQKEQYLKEKIKAIQRELGGLSESMAPSQKFCLTAREQEVLMLRLEGLTIEEMAERMGITADTVKALLPLVTAKIKVFTGREGAQRWRSLLRVSASAIARKPAQARWAKRKD